MIALLQIALPAVALWPWLGRWSSAPPLHRAAAAAGFGTAASGTAFFLWRVAGGDVAIFPSIDTIGWTMVAVIGCAVSLRPRVPSPIGAVRRRRLSRALLGVAAVFVAAAGAFGFTFLLAHPFGGEWDAFAIWNLRAKFLVTPGSDWRNGFDATLGYSHLDYPVLIPSAVARGWLFAERTRNAVPIGISLTLLAASLAVVTSSLLLLRGVTVATIGLVLTATPMFLQQGASQLADVPVGFFTVLAVCFLALPERRRADLVMAGVSAACAAWTKNEGMVVALVLPLCFFAVTMWRDGAARAARDTGLIAVGLAPLMLVVATFKQTLAPQNDLMWGFSNGSAAGHWMDFHRIAFVVRRMGGGVVRWWGGWPLFGPQWLLLLITVISGRTLFRRETAIVATAGLVMSQFAAFFAVYVMTPHDVDWHIQSSWLRLIGQMWPTITWCVCATLDDESYERAM